MRARKNGEDLIGVILLSFAVPTAKGVVNLLGDAGKKKINHLGTLSWLPQTIVSCLEKSGVFFKFSMASHTFLQ